MINKLRGLPIKIGDGYKVGVGILFLIAIAIAIWNSAWNGNALATQAEIQATYRNSDVLKVQVQNEPVGRNITLDTGVWYELTCSGDCLTIVFDQSGENVYQIRAIPHYKSGNVVPVETAVATATVTPADGPGEDPSTPTPAATATATSLPPTSTPTATTTSTNTPTPNPTQTREPTPTVSVGIPTPIDEISKTMEIEDMVFSGSIIEVEDPRASNGAFVDFMAGYGEVEIPIDFAGCYRADIRYAHNERDQRDMQISWSWRNVFVQLPITNGWTTWKTRSYYFAVESVADLDIGVNGGRIVRLRPNQSSGPNLDSLILTYYPQNQTPRECLGDVIGQPVTPETPTPDSTPSAYAPPETPPAPQTPMPLDGVIRYEAEDLVMRQARPLNSINGIDLSISGQIVELLRSAELHIPVRGPGCYDMVFGAYLRSESGDSTFHVGRWGNKSFEMRFDPSFGSIQSRGFEINLTGDSTESFRLTTSSDVQDMGVYIDWVKVQFKKHNSEGVCNFPIGGGYP